ncbi:MAG: energy-coupled thiamine transporter ThiT [Clostridia bacterium]|nr:energy-coupled thiamine transporter ThiT [Clostridia bacterium]
MFQYSLLSSAVDAFEPVAKWLTVCVLAGLIVLCTVVFFARRSAFPKCIKYVLVGLFLYLLALAIAFFALDIAKHYSDEYVEENWLDKQALVQYLLLPLIVLLSLTFLSVTAFLIVGKYKPSAKRLCAIIGGALVFAAFAAVLVCLSVYYNEKIANDGYYNSDDATVKQLALYISAVLTIAAIIGLAFTDKGNLRFDSRALAYAGVCVSMSFALSYIKLWDMPNGGSVTLVSLLPLMLFSYAFGAKKGVFVGLTYGVLQAVQDPWLIHPAQFLLDYPVAFSAAGLAGLLRPVKRLEKLPQLSFALSAVLAGSLRFICHVLSGVFAFEAYAIGQNVWAYSLLYNVYVFIDVALVIIAGVFVLSSKSFVKTIAKAR